MTAPSQRLRFGQVVNAMKSDKNYCISFIFHIKLNSKA
jgi:hypothetical protein